MARVTAHLVALAALGEPYHKSPPTMVGPGRDTRGHMPHPEGYATGCMGISGQEHDEGGIEGTITIRRVPHPKLTHGPGIYHSQ